MPKASMCYPNTMSSNSTPAENERGTIATCENNAKKPTRPLTVYHLFFQLEREYILQTTQGDDDSDSSTPPKIDERPIGKEIDPSMPYRYHHIHLSPTWYESGSGKRTGKKIKKRKHRKTHGKISFLDLSKRIAATWAGLEKSDRETKEYVTKIAGRELEVYRRAVMEYKCLLAKEADSKVDSMDADELKLWINQASTASRSCEKMPAKRAGEATAAEYDSSRSHSPTQANIGATNTILPEHSVPLLPWSKPEGNLPQLSAVVQSKSKSASLTQSVNYEAASSDAFDVATSHKEAHPMLLTSNAKYGFMKDEEMQDTSEEENNDFEEFSFYPVPSSILKRCEDDVKDGGRRPTSSGPSSNMSSPSSRRSSGPKIASSRSIAMQNTQTPCGYSRREATLPVQNQPAQHRQSDRSGSVFRKSNSLRGNDLGGGGIYPSVGSHHAICPVQLLKSLRECQKEFNKIDSRTARRSRSLDMTSTPLPCGFSRREAMLSAQRPQHRHSDPSLGSDDASGNEGGGRAGVVSHPGAYQKGLTKMEAFLSCSDRQRDPSRGSGFDFGVVAGGNNPFFSRRPASASDDVHAPSRIEPRTVGLDEAVGITSEDAMGLMKALF